LLEATLPADTGAAIAGDLCEEFSAHVAPSRGVWAARWWFRWQVARSLAPLFLRSWQRASILRAAAAVAVAGAAVTTPAALLLALRTFVLQQVPLKTTPEMSLAFVAALTMLVACSTAGALLAAVRLLARR
jgi:hypothetical protein